VMSADGTRVLFLGAGPAAPTLESIALAGGTPQPLITSATGLWAGQGRIFASRDEPDPALAFQTGLYLVGQE
jgi:hypothetical protein